MALVDWGRLKMQNKDGKRFFNSGEKPVIAEKLGVTGSFYLRIYVFEGPFYLRIHTYSKAHSTYVYVFEGSFYLRIRIRGLILPTY